MLFIADIIFIHLQTLGKLWRQCGRFFSNLKYIFDGTLLYIGVLCQQGSEYAGSEKYYSTKFGLFLLFTYSFLILQFYSASIVGSLLMAPPKNIRTIPDLIRSSLEVGMQDIVYNYDFFRVRSQCPFGF